MAAFSYEFKLSGLVKAPAQKVGELFEKLQNSPDGLSPSTVLNASRKKGSLLHDDFEWNDGGAAEKYRLQQARFIIQNMVVITETTDQDQRTVYKDRAYVSATAKTEAYVPIHNALSNEEWRSHLDSTMI